MDLKKTTILGLFDGNTQFTIPVYQRAYSWQKENWKVFLDDLLQQVEMENEYSFGNILLETIRKEQLYEIIDGQQRLTTIVIFLRALYNVLKEKDSTLEQLENIQYYMKDRNIKLRPVEHDRSCFDNVIIYDKSYSPTSISQERIVEAKEFFIGELKVRDKEFILKLLDLVLGSGINRIELKGKKEAALMFELQNNRGRDLTNMEKLKSFFMYQMYVCSSAEETDQNVETISNYFNDIYRTIYDIKSLDEDSILIYHCQAFLNISYNYRKLDDIKNEYNSSHDKKGWIIDFCNNLVQTFKDIKTMESETCPFYKKLLTLSGDKLSAFVYPFIIKGYKFFRDDKSKLDKLFHILEVLTFRYELIPSRAYFISRINDSLKNFNGDLDALKNSLHNKLNEEWHWSDNRMTEVLNGWMYQNSVLHYLLWEYEATLQPKGYSIINYTIADEQIEHISPQTAPEEAIAAGYDVDAQNNYTDEFKEKYLNCLGNLMLIAGCQNAAIGNRPFATKLSSYDDPNFLKQMQEIKTFVDQNRIEWKKENIEKRLLKILNFAIPRWSFANIK